VGFQGVTTGIVARFETHCICDRIRHDLRDEQNRKHAARVTAAAVQRLEAWEAIVSTAGQPCCRADTNP
jgi:hypothetical protein